jgi:uncharacterized protein (DUF305 family)
MLGRIRDGVKRRRRRVVVVCAAVALPQGATMRTRLRLLVGPTALALGLAGCGEESTTPTASAPRVAGNGVDRAFVSEMIPHHRSAVEMAELAERYSDRPEIRRLADAIVATQNTEIRQMRGLDRRLADAGIAKRRLGMTAHEMGTHMDPSALRRADPFDQEFLDMMIPHHEGAIRMAQVQLERGRNPAVKRLAEAIVDAQTAEINQMHTWRIQWFGVTGHEHH